MKKLLDSPFLWALLTWPPAFIAAGLLYDHYPPWVWAIWGILLPFTLRSNPKSKGKK